MDRYPDISKHGLIGDLQTAALVSTDGTIDWFCCPRLSSAHPRGHTRIGGERVARQGPWVTWVNKGERMSSVGRILAAMRAPCP